VTRDSKFAYNLQVIILILLIIVLEQAISAEMILYAPYREEIFVYPYVVMEFWLYNALKDVTEFFNDEHSYFVILLASGFYLSLLYRLLFVNLRYSGSIYTLGLGLSLGGLFSNALVLTLNGARVAVYVSTTFWDISSYWTFNISTLCMIFGAAICTVGSFFGEDPESPGVEECCEEQQEPNEEQLELSEAK